MSEQTSQRVSERANGRASGPVLQSVFLAVLDHSVERVPHVKKPHLKSADMALVYQAFLPAPGSVTRLFHPTT